MLRHRTPDPDGTLPIIARVAPDAPGDHDARHDTDGTGHHEGGGCACCGGDDSVADAAGRLRLWDLDPGSHCSIIGTCLSLDDLRRIIRKADLALTPDTQDYDIHGYFVSAAAGRTPLSKLIHKTLDRKYAPQLTRFRRSCSPDEIWDLWKQALAAGDVAGAYWALMTHRAVPRLMRIRAHNEVHMLSHLMGKSSRDDIKRLRQMEASCAELTDRLAKTRMRTDALLQERDSRIQQLEAQLAAATAAPPRPVAWADTRPAPIAGQADGPAPIRLPVLERRLKVERARARAAEAKVVELGLKLDMLRRRDGLPRRPGPEATAQPDGVEFDPAAEQMPESAMMAGIEADGPDLEGRALLYVGGHRNLASRLRAHVQQRQGTFLYHDGGVEEQNGKLPGLVSQADAVFCPVGCISHDACLRLKHLCKRQGKRFVLLRSAGLSSFMSALRDLTPERGLPDAGWIPERAGAAGPSIGA